MPLETDVPGYPAAFQAAADYLRRDMASGASTLGDEVLAQRSNLERGWEGEGGSAFGNRANILTGSADGYAELASTMATEVEALGHTLSATQLGMEAIRGKAAAAGLPVAGTLIVEPQFVADNENYERLVNAWNAAVTQHDQQMKDWYDALDHTSAFVKGHASDLIGVTADLMVAGYSAALLAKASKIMSTQALIMTEEASRLAARAGELRKLLHSGQLLDQLDHLDDLYYGSQDAARAAEEAKGFVKEPKIPGPLKGGLGVLSGIMAGYGVYDDMQSGESTQQAVVSQGGGLFAGAVAGGLTGGAIGTAGFPVVGTIVGGVVGAGAGMLADWGIDQAYEHDQAQADAAQPPDPGSHEGSGAAILQLMIEAQSGEPDPPQTEAPGER